MNMENTATKPMRQPCFMPLKQLTHHGIVFANTGLSPFVNTKNILLQQPSKINLHPSQFNFFNPHTYTGKILSKSGVFRYEGLASKVQKQKDKTQVLFLTQPSTLLPFGEIFEAISGTALCLLVLLDVPRELGGDVSDKVAAGPQTVIVAPHSELAVLQRRHTIFNFMSHMR